MRPNTPRRNMFHNFLLAVAIAPALCFCANAQDKPDGCVEWKSYTDTIWVDQEVTENRVINETTYETKEVAKSRPRFISEKLERTITEEKPVEKTSYKTVTRKVTKPVTTTKSRTRTRVVESFEDVTEMREEAYTVRKPVTETVMEKKEVLVRKPVTRRSVKKENVTVYRPQESTQTTVVPGTLLVPGPVTSSRPRIEWLQRGYYGDPQTGQRVWRRPGLHWVDQPQFSQQAVPVAIPQQQTSVTMVPETIVKERPVEETTFVSEYETREVPVTVERMVEETRTRKVPVTVRIPKREVIEEQIPYTETTYVDETITEEVPVTETVMQTVTRKEPYTRVKETWEDYTETVRVPKTTAKRVPYVAKYRVPYLVEVRVPCDANGRPVARGQQVRGTHRVHPNWRKMMTKVAGTKETVKDVVKTSETSVFERYGSSPAKFDVPGSVEAPASASSVMASSVETESQALPDPPNVKFKSETTTALKPIAKAPRKPVVVEPTETEASKELRRRIEERFRKQGLTLWSDEDDKKAESVETTETVDRTLTPDPSAAPTEVEFEPESLKLEVEVPPSAAAPNSDQPAAAESSDAENEDDDTIEEDVDLSRSNRS